jgi:hypothetical protein
VNIRPNRTSFRDDWLEPERSRLWRCVFCFCIVSFVVLSFETSSVFAQDGSAPPLPWYWPRIGDIVAALGISVAAVTVWIALWQAKQNQAWKRKEFMAAQMAAFMADHGVQQTLKILDYSARRLNLSDDETERTLRGVRVDQKLAAAALIPHNFGREKFSRVEIAIRDGFDVFLERVDKFNDMRKVKLLKLEDITPYLKLLARKYCRHRYLSTPALEEVAVAVHRRVWISRRPGALRENRASNQTQTGRHHRPPKRDC